MKVNLLVDLGQAFYFSIKNQCVFVFMLMRNACLKQWIPCIIRISIFGAVLAGKKCVLYTGKYGTSHKSHMSKCSSSKNRKIRDRVDSRVQYGWKLRVMGSWSCEIFVKNAAN